MNNTANIGRIIAFYWEMCYYEAFDQHSFPRCLMLLFLASLLGIPVDLGRNFGSNSYSPKGEELSGDPEMPPTFISGFWGFLNPIRNAFLATFIWREYSLLKVWRSSGIEYRLAFVGGDRRWMAMPAKLSATYIAVKHGRESCKFATIGVDGEEIAFKVLVRGSKGHILRVALNDLRANVPGARNVDEMTIENFITFV